MERISYMEQCEKFITPFAKVIVRDISGTDYYEIVYFDTNTGKFITGYGSYSLHFVRQWLKNNFIIEDTYDRSYSVVYHGVWIPADDGSHFCSECGHTALWKNSGLMIKEYCSDICPYCGALMTCDNEDTRCV